MRRPASTSSRWGSSPGPGSSRPRTRWDFGWLDEVMDLLHAGGIARRPGHRDRVPAALADHRAPGDPAGDRAPARPSGRAPASTGGPPRPVFRSHALRPGPEAWRSGTPTTRPWWPGTSPTSWAATTSTTTPTTRPTPSATGCAPATARSTRSTTPGARRSGRSATATGRRSCRRGWPRSHPNPTQQLDFKRFSSDALKDYLRAERDILREHHPRGPRHHQLHGDGRHEGHELPGLGGARSTSSPTTTTSTRARRTATSCPSPPT